VYGNLPLVPPCAAVHEGHLGGDAKSIHVAASLHIVQGIQNHIETLDPLEPITILEDARMVELDISVRGYL